MKPRHYIALALTLVGVALVVAMLMLPRPLPPDECSDIYRQYKDTPGIKASFIKDYPINDTTTIDVAMLQAQDSTTWVDNLKQLHKIGKEEEFNPQKISFKILPYSESPTDTCTKIMVVGYSVDLTIGVFYMKNKQQFDAIFDKYFDYLYI